MEIQPISNKAHCTANVTVETFDWEKLSVEERKERVKIRMQNLGKYRGCVVFNNPKLRGEG